MAKDRYWFKHDLNARNDDKILAMISDYGALGYGLYWSIVERLHEEDNCIEISERFAMTVGKPMKVKPTKVMSFIHACINEYDLFAAPKGILSAKRVESNLDDRKTISKLRSDAGRKGGKNKQNQAFGKQTEAIAKQNQAEERRGDKKREEEIKESSSLTPDKVFEMLRRSCPKDIQDWQIEQEALKFFEKYGHKRIQSVGALINTWAGNLEPEILSTDKRTMQY